MDGALLISRGGRTGGACNLGLGEGTTGASVGSSLKIESTRSRLPPLSCPLLGGVVGAMLIRISASRVESWFVFSRRIARWVAARAVGDGGRGAGFIAWATDRGIVGTLTEDTTGPVCTRIESHRQGKNYEIKQT